MKQTIKLNESQLRKIVRESVTQMLNEVSPQMAAAYANGRQQQANGQLPLSQAQQRMGNTQQDMKNKAWQGQVAAKDKWNKEYGIDTSEYNGFGDRKDTHNYMGGNDYTVTSNINDFSRDGSRKHYTSTYNPYDDKTMHNYSAFDKYNTEQQNFDDSTEGKQYNFSSRGSKVRNGAEIAQQMANAKWPSRQQ